MDDEEIRNYQRKRESFLAILLTVGGIIAGLAILSLLTGGLFLYVVLVAAAIAGLAFFHYLFWGRSFSEATAGEREEMEIRDQDEIEEWMLPESRRHRHY